VLPRLDIFSLPGRKTPGAGFPKRADRHVMMSIGFFIPSIRSLTSKGSNRLAAISFNGRAMARSRRSKDYFVRCASGIDAQSVTGRSETALTRQVLAPDHAFIGMVGIEFSVFLFGEFDSGSERTLAAWIRHASRTESPR
jgi:hypothetical protein